MAKDITGTPLKLVLDGNTFFYVADATPADGKSKWSGEAVPHSGGNMWKMIRGDAGSTGHKIKANGDEIQILKALAERVDSFPMAFKNRAGDIYQAVGHIAYEERSDGIVEVSLFPDDDWTLTVA